MKKATLVTGITAALALSIGTAYAGHMKQRISYKDAAPACEACGDFEEGMGLGLNYATPYGDDWALMFSYFTPEYYADLGANAELFKFANIFELRGDLGLRRKIQQSLFFTYGLSGSYGFRTNSSRMSIQPWAAGAAVGLQWQPLRHLMVGAQIMPYMYTRNYVGTSANTIFSNGSIGLTYVF